MIAFLILTRYNSKIKLKTVVVVIKALTNTVKQNAVFSNSPQKAYYHVCYVDVLHRKWALSALVP